MPIFRAYATLVCYLNWMRHTAFKRSIGISYIDYGNVRQVVLASYLHWMRNAIFQSSIAIGFGNYRRVDSASNVNWSLVSGFNLQFPFEWSYNIKNIDLNGITAATYTYNIDIHSIEASLAWFARTYFALNENAEFGNEKMKENGKSDSVFYNARIADVEEVEYFCISLVF